MYIQQLKQVFFFFSGYWLLSHSSNGNRGSWVLYKMKLRLLQLALRYAYSIIILSRRLLFIYIEEHWWISPMQPEWQEQWNRQKLITLTGQSEDITLIKAKNIVASNHSACANMPDLIPCEAYCQPLHCFPTCAFCSFFPLVLLFFHPHMAPHNLTHISSHPPEPADARFRHQPCFFLCFFFFPMQHRFRWSWCSHPHIPQKEGN